MSRRRGTGTAAAAAGLLALTLLISGCSAPLRPRTEPPLHPVEKLVENPTNHPLYVYDPLEGLNRRLYTFNYYLDRYLFLPVVGVYEAVLPDYAEKRVSSFVDNVAEFGNFINNLLQLKLRATGITLGRFAINTTLGIAGLWDPAFAWGLDRQPEDFGQTLGHYGVGDGPFLVLPVFGPSNLRDATGLAVDFIAFGEIGPAAWVDDAEIEFGFALLRAVDTRHRQSFRYYQTGSPFEYDLIRFLYSRKRQLLIRN